MTKGKAANHSKRIANRKAVAVRAAANAAAERNEDSLVKLKLFQSPIFWSTVGVLILHWSRQIGKSFVLASWAVYRLLTKPGRLVTVLSNSKDNGIEFMQKVREVCALAGVAFEQEDLSPDEFFENMQIEARIKVGGKIGRIKILAANPRTARGFSGDLILDEFAFHEDASAIWSAAEPILSSNGDYLCRIVSTPNGKHNLFYRLCTNELYQVNKVTRSEAYAEGCEIFHPSTRQKIDPVTARALAPNKRIYDQNYECVFEDENMALLTQDLVTA